MMWSSAISCFIAMFALAQHVRGEKQLFSRDSQGCLGILDRSPGSIEGCNIERSEQLNCVTAISNCPKECKDSSGRIHKQNEEWEELKFGVLHDCTCKVPIPWIPHMPPTGMCNPRGCAGPCSRQMRYGEQYYKVLDGNRYVCGCYEGPSPNLENDSSLSHILCAILR